jgi:hypothetical protein
MSFGVMNLYFSSVFELCIELREIQPQQSCDIQERGKMKAVGLMHCDLACLCKNPVIFENCVIN